MPQLPITPNRFKEGLRERQQIGIWCTLCSNIVTEVLGQSGFDWMLIDTEHSPNDMRDVLGQLQSVSASATSPIVRPAWNDPVLIKRYLDIGAQTLLIPFVQNAAEAEAAVRAVRYPSRGGVRGVAGSHRGSHYGRAIDYLNIANDTICVVAQIETGAAVDAIPEIAAVEGLDAIFIGPSDLSADLGHAGNPLHPEVQDAIARAVDLAKAAGIPVGTLTPRRDQAEKWLDAGCAFVGVGIDVNLLVTNGDALAAHFLERLARA